MMIRTKIAKGIRGGGGKITVNLRIKKASCKFKRTPAGLTWG